MFLNKKIKEARLEKKLTQKEFANLLTEKGCKTSHATISNWELNISSPDVDTLQIICDVLEKDGNYFFDTQTYEDSVALNTIQNKYGKNSIQLLNNYNKLNDLGKETANIYVESLTEAPKYTETKNEPSEKRAK